MSVWQSLNNMEILQAICGILIIVNVEAANNITYNVTVPQNNNTDILYYENEDNVTENSNGLPVVPSQPDDINKTISLFSTIIYKTQVNISVNSSDESKLPSIFDLTSYNNTCSTTPKQRTCYIQQNQTGEEEAELCRQYVNIVRLAYVFSCYDNVPGDQLINASRDYVKKLSEFLKTQEHLHEYYTQSISDVYKMAQVVKMADIQAAQGVKAYSLPHSPQDGFQLVPKEIPVRYKEHKIYIVELDKYLHQTYNLSNYMRENNLINVYPYLYEILLNILQHTEAYFREDLFTLAKLENLFENYNNFINGYYIFDVAVLGTAAILFVIGMILNIILLAVFVRFKDTRTYANAMLINLVIVDCISLVFNLLVYYVIDRYFYSRISCTVLTILILIRHISYIVSIYSVVIISFQRYRAVSQPSVPSGRKLGVKTKTAIMTCGVWILAMLYSFPHMAFVEYSEGDCAYNLGKYDMLMVNIQFCVLCVFPLVLVTVFSIMASYKLRKSIEALPGERMGVESRIQQRTVSSRILLGLIFLSVIGYMPNHVATYVFYYGTGTANQGFSLFRTPSVFEYVNAITYNLLHINSCFNPLVIYLLSSKFRKYYHEIICVCKSIRMNKRESLTEDTEL